MILDSMVLIYAVEPSYVRLRAYLAEQKEQPFVSLITKLEVLGFHKLTPDDEVELKRLLATSAILPINDIIIAEAIRLRQQRRRSLGDSIIAATGLLYNLPVLTNNVADFADIDGLRVIALADIVSA